jgi:pimeloyl-ACP methyl ester carboxylesterase
MNDAYQPAKASRTGRFEVRGLEYAVRFWGPESAPPLMLLHGMRDTSATFQFLVDALKHTWRIVAPDWRGHGHTQSAMQGYWFHDYLADLEALVDTLFPEGSLALVGHSMGGNVAGVYAGLRPEKVSHMISIDGFGMLGPTPAEFRDRLSKWMRQGRNALQKRYETLDDMARKLSAANSRLSWDKALFLAASLSRPLPEGGFTWQFDVVDRRSMPTMHALEEWIACWQCISAPRLWVAATDARPGTLPSDLHAFAAVMQHISEGCCVRIPQTGHNVHHDRPDELAAIIERFVLGR